ncbi:MAG TPA: leucyl aminopeptidase [Sandaracinaceae bacterium]
MKVTLSTDAPVAVKADLLAVGVRAGSAGTDPLIKELDQASQGALRAQIKLEDFEGKPGQVLKTVVPGIGAKQLLLVGLGDSVGTTAAARTLAARAAQTAQAYGSLAIVVPSEDARAVRAAASGAVLGAYRFTRYLTGERQPKRTLGSVKLLVETRSAEQRAALDKGVALGECVNAARDLVNAPPNDLYPATLADFAKAKAAELGFECKIWDKKGIEKLGMHLLLAVNRGSGKEPRFVHMTYKPARKPVAKVAFVGKGLTFDAGGLCLKPAKSMVDMKCDMAGAAATIGILMAAARLKLPVEVHGVVGATENMLGDDAYRPGDVFPSLDGKTVEIVNTDAEGRLVLADALAYARKLGADYLIDHATLTGACMVALGPWTAGLFTGVDELAERYLAAGNEEGESFWRMPLLEDLRESLRSDVADLKHTGDPHGGAISAALFLREFVGDARWMHLDIAGPAFQERPHGIQPKGASGFGVLTAVRFLESLAGKG